MHQSKAAPHDVVAPHGVSHHCSAVTQAEGASTKSRLGIHWAYIRHTLPHLVKFSFDM
jgi:hypothetical protein